MKWHISTLCPLAILSAANAVFSSEPASIELLRIPDNGIQPQASVDTRGVLHLIYYKGDPRAGDVFYVRQEPGAKIFSKPIRVNTEPGAAIAMGTIRGAQMAIGKNGRIHVAWNGSRTAAVAKHEGAPMLYARLNDAGSAFEAERDLITDAAGLDGGGSVAADLDGNVYVVWHASAPGNKLGEAGRAVFVSLSKDEGKTFEREKQANPKPTGACGCCGLRAFADSRGTVFILYRAASEKVNRPEILLISKDHGDTFQLANEHQWNIAACPMSSASLVESHGATLAAWETEGQVYCAKIDTKNSKAAPIFSPSGMGKRKHPVAVSNSKGETLFVWTDGTGWQKGGTLAWQLFDTQGKPLAVQEKKDVIPVWSFASAVPKPDGTFGILY